MGARALLLDYGGVMTSPVTASFSSFCTSEGIGFAAFKSVMSGAARTPGSPFALIETGAITQEQFDDAVAKLLSEACGRTIAARGLKQRLFAEVRPDEAMWRAVRDARAAGTRTALLSNSWGGRDYPIDELRTIFDAIVISGEVGMRKPDADIYRFTAAKVGVPADACIFVDDFNVNVEGAEAVGMTGILHADARRTIEQLHTMLSFPLQPPADAREHRR
jgi:epoxide hydrolase-like predicted phosphatase